MLTTFDTHKPEHYARSTETGQFPRHFMHGSAYWETVTDVTRPPGAADDHDPARCSPGVLQRQRGKDATHVFTFRGKPLRNANNRAWRAALKACGIEDFRWHDLRHTWASWLRQNDVPTWVLQELGGWKSESMVRRYAHMSVTHLAPHADQLIFPDTVGNGGNSPIAIAADGHKSGHSQRAFRLKLMAGTDLNL